MALRTSYSPGSMMSGQRTPVMMVQKDLQICKEENLKLKEKLLKLSSDLSKANSQNTQLKVRLMAAQKDTQRLVSNLQKECDSKLAQPHISPTARLRQYEKKLKIHEIVRKQQLVEINKLVEQTVILRVDLEASQNLVGHSQMSQSQAYLQEELQMKHNELEAMFSENKKLREENQMLNEYVLNLPNFTGEVSDTPSQIIADIQEAFVDLSSLMQAVMTGQVIQPSEAIQYRNALENLQNNMEMLTNKIYNLN